ncbi:hypothetical protein FIV42_02535 [Persicimonas caeni]|uniref:Uncharacterized protein n=1 Tax=Persicimonas caeni TaxID=2292766 RepID=A0A4Y6PMX3_PERCE|nr:hypothetical protein [Persicimonas caeni]QDG49656.1 hypothetical protein FIV42_02535 [Persicimonas caeni]QED30877.1 hypothetical protein FRD00_02530 [Persicimonas caeni]
MSPIADTDTSMATTPTFATLENEIDGVVANARISFALTTAQRAAEHGEWSRAVESLEKLAEKLSTWDVPREAWCELLVAAAWYAVRGSNVAALTPLFEGFAERAWPGPKHAKDRQSMPWELQEAFDEADRRGRYDAGHRLGRLVTALYPSCPLGSYATAHFAERNAQIHGHNVDTAEVAADFEQAAQLADALDMPATKERALLRAGALRLRTGTGRERGRELMREVDPAHFDRPDRLWYAVGMAHSPFWLDRVRAADAVLAVAEQDADPDQKPARDTTDTAAYLLDCAPIELQPLEIDRFEALADALGGQAKELKLRSHLEGIASAPATQAGEAADILAQSYGDDATDAERAQIAFCRAASDLVADGEHTGLDEGTVERVRNAFPVAAKVLEVLEPAVRADAPKLATALGELEGLFRKRGPAKRNLGALGPIALLWPHVLPLLRELRDDEDVDPTTVRRIEASTKEILTRWLPKAATPGYGWWALAANLLTHDLPDAAAQAARRALDHGESVGDDLERRVIAAILDRAVRGGEPEAMLEWLEVAEALRP